MHYKRHNVLGNFLIFNKLYLCHIKGRLNKKVAFSCPFCMCLTMHEIYSPTPCKAPHILKGLVQYPGSEPPLHKTAATSRREALFKWRTVSLTWRGKWQWSDKVNHAPHRGELGGVKITFLSLTHNLHVLSGSDCCGSPVLKHMWNFLQTSTLKIK